MPHPTRPCRCAVGRHAAAADIDAALATGDSLNQILARYDPIGFSRTTLAAHSLKCLGLGKGARTAVQPSSGQPFAQPDSAAQQPPVQPPTPDGRRRPGATPPPGCPTKEARVTYIISLMARLEWVTGVTGPELAERWGCHPGTVEHDACEASRAVQRQVDPGAVQATVMAALHEALEIGLDFARSKEVNGRVREGDPKALNSIALLAKSMAVFAPAPAPQRGATAERPTLNVIYAEGVPPDGHPVQPPAVPGSPGADPRP